MRMGYNNTYMAYKAEPEKEAVKNLLETWPTHQRLWESLSIPFPFCWVGLQIPTARLLDYDLAKRLKLETDIDLLGGALELNVTVEEWRERLKQLHQKYGREGYVRQLDQVTGEYIERKLSSSPEQFSCHLSHQLVYEGRMKWPPELKEIGALQAKRTGVYSRGGDGVVLRPTLQNEIVKLRGQAKKTPKMGFDRVVLLLILLGQPMPGKGFEAWTEGAAVAWDGLEKAKESFEPLFSPEDPFARAYLPWGGIAGWKRTEAGAVHVSMSGSPQNPRLEEPSVKEVRSAMVANLEKIFSETPRPTFSPVYLLCCQSRNCGDLFISYMYGTGYCPECMKKEILPRALKELKAALRQAYGERFVKLILFGSWARGEEVQGSDVDLLLVLHDVSSNFAELGCISQISSPVSLKYDLLFSVRPVDLEAYQRRPGSAFLASVQKEGLTV